MKNQRLLQNLCCSCKAFFVRRGLNSTSSSNVLKEQGRELSTVAQVASTSPEMRPESSSSDSVSRKTSMFDLHLKYGGKMVPFAGYMLPVQYSDAGISLSHQHTRSNCSIFDVSHMLQTNIRGKHAVQFIESLCVTDVAGMKNNQSALSLYTIDGCGGIIDDLIVTKIADDALYLVSNASRQNVDKELLLDRLDLFKAKGKDVHVQFLDSNEQSLVAIQGPKTVQILQPFIGIDLQKLYFMNSVVTNIFGIDNCRITRCGYTGEDGVEISISSKYASEMVENLLKNDFVKLAGLGARDTLRLESGLCLYGNDIDERTTPIEAGLTWTIGKRRRMEKDFPGAEFIMKQLQDGVSKKRVGIVREGGPPARAGTKILGSDDKVIGEVTSGCPSPTLGTNIAMAYVMASQSTNGNNVKFDIRGKHYTGNVTKMPFGNVHYYTKPKPKKV